MLILRAAIHFTRRIKMLHLSDATRWKNRKDNTLEIEDALGSRVDEEVELRVTSLSGNIAAKTIAITAYRCLDIILFPDSNN